jgi:multicomponent Na+:H+ antiporter subunit E
MAYLTTTLLLFLVYLALTQNLQPSNIVVGLLIGLAVSILIKPKRGIPLARLPGAVVALTIYIVRLLIDIVKSGIIVSGYILNPKLPIKPGVVAIKSQSSNTAITVISAHGITITPGEMVMEIGSDGTMYTHCLNAPASAQSGDEAQAARKKLLEEVLIWRKS